MRILSRYILREFLIPLTFCLTGFIGIYVMFELFHSFQRLLETKPSTWTVIAFFAGYLSPYLQWLVPAALMLATLYTMWNFCRHSEVTAMRASGIGFSSIVAPIQTVAACFTIGVTLVNEYYAPYASEWAKNFRTARFRPLDAKLYTNVPYYNQKAHRIWRVDKMDTRTPNLLQGVKISIDRPDGSRDVDIACRKAEYLDGEWWLSYPQYQYFDELNNPIENPTPSLARLMIRSFPEFDETPRDFLLMNKPWEYYTARDMVHYLKNHKNLKPVERASKVYDLYNRFAVPFSCIIITLFAIPAGVATGRQSVFKGVIFAVGMFFAFYAFSIGCMILAKNGLLPPLVAAWFPNLLFLGIGLFLFRRQR
ncbi:MAG: LptF/LptG family permease [Kiritimatiellae bacterium]|nr:LptF/LptG family permease [Kiritimatiellia bacterium]